VSEHERARDTALNRASWNVATANHNQHKGDQAAELRAGRDPLFPEELELLGPLDGVDLVHLQCNAGQDSLGLARRGASVTGVDLSDTAIEFARTLSRDSGIAARFERDEVVSWMQCTPERFDVAFASYGTIGWIRDLAAWMRGVHRVLRPGGRLVLVEFHPVVYSVDAELRLGRDDYFAFGPYDDPVGDYVAASLPDAGEALPNAAPAHSFQHTLAATLQAVLDAGLVLEQVREYPHSNFCRCIDALVPGPDRTWVFPPGTARIPLMYGLVARRP